MVGGEVVAAGGDGGQRWWQVRVCYVAGGGSTNGSHTWKRRVRGQGGVAVGAEGWGLVGSGKKRRGGDEFIGLEVSCFTR